MRRHLDCCRYCTDEAIPLDVVSACGIVGGSYLGYYSENEFHGMLASSRAEYQHNLDLLISHFQSVPPETVHLLQGEASVEIPAFQARNKIDLLVLGTVARRGISGFFLGNTAEVILKKVECSVIVVKPAGFVLPVKAQTLKRNTVALAM